MNSATRLVGARRQGSIAARALANSWASSAARATASAPSTWPERLPRQRLDAFEPVARGVAGAKLHIGLGQFGMRVGAPGALDHAVGFAELPALGDQPAGQRGRRHQSRRQLLGFERKRLGSVAIGIFQREGAGGEQHRALPGDTSLCRNGRRCVRAGLSAPAQSCSLVRASSTARPAQASDGAPRAAFLGKSAGGGMIVAAPCFNEEAVQAERLGVGTACHGTEHAFGAVAVAGKLGGLRAQQQRKRLVGGDAVDFGAQSPRDGHVTGADGDQAARHRLVSAHTAAMAPAPGEDGRQAQNRDDDG